MFTHWKTLGPSSGNCGSASCSSSGSCAKAPAFNALAMRPPPQKAPAIFYTGMGRRALVSTSSPQKQFHSTLKLDCRKPRLCVVSLCVRACQKTVSCGRRFPEAHKSQQIISRMNAQLFINKVPVSCPIACSVGKMEIWQLLLILQSGWQTPNAQHRGGVQRKTRAN